MVPGAIPWRDILAWCEFHDRAGEDVAFLSLCCSEMDAEYLAYRKRVS